jgi:hypothetical protein
VNPQGYLRIMFAVDDIDETLERLRKRGAQLTGEVIQYKTRIGSATSAGLKGFSSDLPRNSADRKMKIRKSGRCQRARLTTGRFCNGAEALNETRRSDIAKVSCRVIATFPQQVPASIRRPSIQVSDRYAKSQMSVTKRRDRSIIVLIVYCRERISAARKFSGSGPLSRLAACKRPTSRKSTRRRSTDTPLMIHSAELLRDRFDQRRAGGGWKPSNRLLRSTRQFARQNFDQPIY